MNSSRDSTPSLLVSKKERKVAIGPGRVLLTNHRGVELYEPSILLSLRTPWPVEQASMNALSRSSLRASTSTPPATAAPPDLNKRWEAQGTRPLPHQPR